MLPIISLRAHKVLDYLMGAYLAFFPWISDLSNDHIAPWVMMIAGIVLINYSFLTKYKKRSLSGYFTVRTHLWMDGCLGVILLISPWVFGFSHVAYLPHIVAGMILILMAVLSKGYPKKTMFDKVPSAETQAAV